MSSVFRFILGLFGFTKSEPEAYAPNVSNFIEALKPIAPPAGQGSFLFLKSDGSNHGFVQFIVESDRRLKIHRLFTPQSGMGNGTLMMRTLCNLADQHGVELELKVLPIGRKPYPMSRQQLKIWYESYYFAGSKWKLVRMPRGGQKSANQPETIGCPEPTV